MRKLIVEEWVSLDGYAADRNGTTDFFPSTKENRYSDEDQLKFLESVDTILLGRKTYEVFVDFWPTEKSKQEIIAENSTAFQKSFCQAHLKMLHGEIGEMPKFCLEML